MKRNRSTKSGNALITVLGLMAVLSVSFGMLMANSGQSSHTTKRMVDRTKAVAYAEAGIEFAYSVLRADYENRNNPGMFRLDSSTTYTTGAALESSYGVTS